MSHLGPTLRRKRRTPSTARRLLAAAALSLLLNLLFLQRLDLSWLDQASAPRRAVAMAPLTARDWEANRAVGQQPPRPQRQRPVAPPPVPPPDPETGQVVSIAPPKEPPKEPPREAKYLAEHDSAVEKETRSRDVGPGRGQPPQAAVPGGPAGRPEAEEKKVAAAEKKVDAREAREEVPRRLAFDWKPRGDVAREASRQTAQPPAAPGPSGPRGAPDADGSDRKPDLRPGAAAWAALGGMGSPDKIDGVDEGDETFLNTRQFRFAGFFNRVKQDIYTPWSDEVHSAIQARDPSGQRFLYRDRTTWVDVRLDAQGHLKATAILERSGADFLDEAARHAFAKVGVFANPPPGLVDANGEIRFSFGFTINGVSDLPTFRYRYNGP